jgi:ABC-2 type transport system permease protein
MGKILTAARKELLLLRRDRAGLLLLFIMPALLVVVITLVQENVMELTGQKKTKVLYLDLDGGPMARLLKEELEKGYLELILWQESKGGEKVFRDAVTSGKYQAGIIIPSGASSAIEKNVSDFFSGQNGTEPSPGEDLRVVVVYDPGIMPSLRSGLQAQLQSGIKKIGIGEKIDNLVGELERVLDQHNIPKERAPFATDGLATFLEKPLITLEDDGGEGGAEPTYDPVQQNVPAWALFGMFFTALPIAGGLLQERKTGIWIRLCSLPVSLMTLLLGKIVAYLLVCLSQFLLIVVIGAFLFPLLGLPAFLISEKLISLLIVILCSGLAACSFGLMLGAFCRTYEQALACGATSIVLCAALGGVMVPVYAMPQTMQRWSVLSPLNWGLDAFQNLTMRGATFINVVDDLGRLFIFFMILLLLSWRRVQWQA